MRNVFLVLLLISYAYIAAQNQNDSWTENKPKVFLPSPQSQMFEKYLNHEIAEYNGLPEISIPLYEIEIKGLKIPITIDYHASGIKYKQIDGDIAAGWAINIGGYRVSRTIYGGVPDGIINRVPVSQFLWQKERYQKGSVAEQVLVNNTFFKGLAGDSQTRNSKSECDQFSYILPSTSGHFILDDFGKPFIYETNQDKIEMGENLLYEGYKGITITDNSGFKYFMGGTGFIEYTEIPLESFSGMQPSSWVLREIQSPYKDRIKFLYSESVRKPYPFDDIFFATGASITWSDHAQNNPQKPAHQMATSLTPIPSKLPELANYQTLSLNHIIVNDFERISISGNSIEIRYNEKLIRKISFEYDERNEKRWHTLLKKIKILDTNSGSMKEYSFDYFPGKTTLPDQYEFYSNTLFNPQEPYSLKSYLHEDFMEDDILNFYMATKLKDCYNPSLIKFYDRNPKQVANHYMLRRITFPSKGYTEYEYEMSGWYNAPRVKRIISKAEANSLPIVTDYIYDNLSSNILMEEPYYQYFADEQVTGYPVLWGMAGGVPAYVLNFGKTTTYSSRPIIPEVWNRHIQYGKVTKIQTDIHGNSLGTTVSMYNIPFQYTIGHFEHKAKSPNESEINYFSQYGDFYVNRYQLGFKPTIKSQTFYDYKNRKKKEINYTYHKRGEKTYTGFKVERRVIIPDMYVEPLAGMFIEYLPSQHPDQYSHGLYYIDSGSDFLSTKETITYFDNGESVQEEEYYEYNKYHQLAKTEYVDSRRYIWTKDYTYVWAYHPIWESINFISPVATTVTSKMGAMNSKTIETLEIKYPQKLTTQPSLLYPDSVVSTINGQSKTYVKYDKYDMKGNVLQYTGLDGLTVTHLWGYNGKYPIAEIKNATYENVSRAIGSSLIDRVLIDPVLQEGDKWAIDKLRELLPASIVITYTYQPGVGIRTMTNSVGETTYYEYDFMGRLIRIQDNDGNTIEDYDYHYKK